MNRRDADGKLLPEMILVCNALKNYLENANEYVRGFTLRFLCSFREPELLDSLVPSVLKCAEHRHSYVRKYACLAIAAVHLCQAELIPDAVQLLNQMFLNEQNPSAKRNIFIALQQVDVRLALDSLTLPLLNQGGEHLQFAVLSSIRSLLLQSGATGVALSDSDPEQFDRLQTLTAALLQLSTSQAVQFEAANTVLQMFSSQSDLVTTAITAYCSLLRNSSESSVRYLCLTRLHQLLPRYRSEIQSNLLELLHFFPTKGGGSATSTLSPTLAKLLLTLLFDLLSPSNSEQIINHLVLCLQNVSSQLLHRETKSVLLASPSSMSSSDLSVTAAASTPASAAPIAAPKSQAEDELIRALQRMHQHFFAQLLKSPNAQSDHANSLRSLCQRISESLLPLVCSPLVNIARSVCDTVRIQLSMSSSAIDAAQLATLVLSKCPHQECIRTVLPILADCSLEHCFAVFNAIIDVMSPLNFADAPQDDESQVCFCVWGGGDPIHRDLSLSHTLINLHTQIGLRSIICAGSTSQRSFFVASSLCSCLAVLALRCQYRVSSTLPLASSSTQLPATVTAQELHQMRARIMLVVTMLMRFGESQGIDPDSKHRLSLLLRVLIDQQLAQSFLRDRDLSQIAMPSLKLTPTTIATAAPLNLQENRPGAPLRCRLLGAERPSSILMDEQKAMLQALGRDTKSATGAFSTDRPLGLLANIHAMSGYSDPIYVESSMLVQNFSIVATFFVVNLSPSTLTNVTLDLHTTTNLRIVERPHPIRALKTGESSTVVINMRITAADVTTVFGSAMWDGGHGQQKPFIRLSPVQLSLVLFLRPHSLEDEEFRELWSELEWENKITVVDDSTTSSALIDFVRDVQSVTRMQILRMPSEAQIASNFLSVNLAAKSLFGLCFYRC